jgi:hypothetical protein
MRQMIVMQPIHVSQKEVAGEPVMPVEKVLSNGDA